MSSGVAAAIWFCTSVSVSEPEVVDDEPVPPLPFWLMGVLFGWGGASGIPSDAWPRLRNAILGSFWEFLVAKSKAR
jgi:hypothetical protein